MKESKGPGGEGHEIQRQRKEGKSGGLKKAHYAEGKPSSKPKKD